MEAVASLAASKEIESDGKREDNMMEGKCSEERKSWSKGGEGESLARKAEGREKSKRESGR